MAGMLRIMRWLSAFAVVLLLSMLAWQCVDIYQAGIADVDISPQSIYRMDDVIHRLHSIRIPLIVCALLLGMTIFLHCFAHQGTPKLKTKISAENLLQLRKKQVGSLPEQAKREESFRNRVRAAAVILMLPCIIISGRYLLDVSNFTSWDLESVMGQMVLHVSPWILIVFALAAAASALCNRSIKREIAALSGLPRSGESAVPNKENSVAMLRIGMYVLAAAFIVLGVMNGGWYDVLVKAINICTECIGLG